MGPCAQQHEIRTHQPTEIVGGSSGPKVFLTCSELTPCVDPLDSERSILRSDSSVSSSDGPSLSTTQKESGV